MNKYTVRLNDDFSEQTRQELNDQGIFVRFADGILPDFITIAAKQEIEELRNNPLFKSVKKTRVGTLIV